ncbi:LOW QUALITY PROTEIN: hypothetical protein QYF61_017570, partial [Mycteria americana]
MFQGRVPSTHHAADAMWMGLTDHTTGLNRKPQSLRDLGSNYGLARRQRSQDITRGEVTHAEDAPLYNKLPANEKQYALFTDGSCRIVGKHQRWKAAVWSPIQQVVETAEGDGELSQFVLRMSGLDHLQKFTVK